MRKVILGCGVSLDGYIARPDGSVDFLVMTKEVAKLMAEFWKTVDVVLFGRKTYEITQKMIASGEGPPDEGAPYRTYVFSRTLPPGERNRMTFVNESPAVWLRKIRRKPGKHIYHMGGGELARSFLEADLVDEIWIGIVPVLLGAGIPLFPPGFPQRDFKLTECKRDSKGGVSLRYARLRKGSTARPKRRG